MDAEQAIRLVRSISKEWNIDPKKIGVIGFSAGGHLASTVSTHFDYGSKNSENKIEKTSSRPCSRCSVSRKNFEKSFIVETSPSPPK